MGKFRLTKAGIIRLLKKTVIDMVRKNYGTDVLIFDECKKGFN